MIFSISLMINNLFMGTLSLSCQDYNERDIRKVVWSRRWSMSVYVFTDRKKCNTLCKDSKEVKF